MNKLPRRYVDRFVGEYGFLALSYPCAVGLKDESRIKNGERVYEYLYPSVAHAYHASRLQGDLRPYRDYVAIAKTAQEAMDTAFFYGGEYTVTGYNWERENIMRDLLNQKFRRGSALLGMLLSTRDDVLIHKPYKLGRLLMELRESERCLIPIDNNANNSIPGPAAIDWELFRIARPDHGMGEFHLPNIGDDFESFRLVFEEIAKHPRSNARLRELQVPIELEEEPEEIEA